MHPKERPHRLSSEAYVGEVSMAVTCAIAGRSPVFTNREVVEAILERLTQACEKEAAEIVLYCFMPDHLHAIVRGRERNSNLLNFMKRFKQSSGFWLSQNLSVRWSGDYYDHVIRNSSDFSEHCQYILGNPVRAGIAEHMFAYPFTGSMLASIEELAQSL